MKVRVKGDEVRIDGYVNAVERLSKPLWSILGDFVERIKAGAFGRALERNNDVRLLMNHDWGRDLGGTSDGTLMLREDAIGLRASAVIHDRQVAEEARAGTLTGWSFGFEDVDVDQHEEAGRIVRDVKDLKLYEVSLLGAGHEPAYAGTLVTARENRDVRLHLREAEDGAEISEEEATAPAASPEEPAIDYSSYEAMIDEMKGDWK